MPEVSQDTIRDCIKSYLLSKGMTYKDLADRVGLSTQTVYNYMSKKVMSDQTIIKIAHALNYPVDMLMNGQRYYGANTVEELAERLNALEERVRVLEGKAGQ